MSREVALILDAIDGKRAPGTVVRISGNDVPRRIPPHLSPHEINLHELFALLELRGTMPARVVALGIQPESIEFGVGCTPAVAASVDALADAAARQLMEFGVTLRRREPLLAEFTHTPQEVRVNA